MKTAIGGSTFKATINTMYKPVREFAPKKGCTVPCHVSWLDVFDPDNQPRHLLC